MAPKLRQSRSWTRSTHTSGVFSARKSCCTAVLTSIYKSLVNTPCRKQVRPVESRTHVTTKIVVPTQHQELPTHQPQNMIERATNPSRRLGSERRGHRLYGILCTSFDCQGSSVIFVVGLLKERFAYVRDFLTRVTLASQLQRVWWHTNSTATATARRTTRCFPQSVRGVFRGLTLSAMPLRLRCSCTSLPQQER